MSKHTTSSDVNFTELTWHDVRSDVRAVNTELYDHIEAISPSKKYRIIQCDYRYGDLVFDNGEALCLPAHSGNTVRLDDASVPARLQAALGYAVMPLGLQLSGVGEVFFERLTHSLPVRVLQPGSLFGLFASVAAMTQCPVSPSWHITAGARSVFMLPKISDTVRHNKLKVAFNITHPPPTDLVDHWGVFKDLARFDNATPPWQSKALFFEKKWLDDHGNDPHWLAFHKYLLKKAWIESHPLRMWVEMNTLWEYFGEAVRRRNLKPTPYLIGTIKHLLALSSGVVPAFKPVDDTEHALPARLIEQAYLDVYHVDHAPTIVHPAYLKPNDPSPVYYSMAHPTLLEGNALLAAQRTSIIAELRECIRLVEMLDDVLSKQTESIYSIIKDKRYTFFHSDHDKFGEVTNSQIIADEDTLITQSMTSRFKGKTFARHAKFLKGCIRVDRSPTQQLDLIDLGE